MRAAGERLTTAVRIGTDVARCVAAAARRPDRAVDMDRGDARAAQGAGRPGHGDRRKDSTSEADEANVTTANVGRLILESDMPGGPNSVAGPPPAGTTFDAPPLPSLVHDAAWFRAVRGRRLPRSPARPPRRAVRAGCGAAVNEQRRGLSRRGGARRRPSDRTADECRARRDHRHVHRSPRRAVRAPTAQAGDVRDRSRPAAPPAPRAGARDVRRSVPSRDRDDPVEPSRRAHRLHRAVAVPRIGRPPAVPRRAVRDRGRRPGSWCRR